MKDLQELLFVKNEKDTRANIELLFTGSEKMSCAFYIAKYVRERAIVLQAINAKQGQTYSEIRKWIEDNKGFTMEGVGARCRQLHSLGLIRKETEKSGRVHVYLNP